MKIVLFIGAFAGWLLLGSFTYGQEETSEAPISRVLEEYSGIASGRQVQKYPLRLKEDKIIRVTIDSQDGTSYFLIREEQGQIVVQLETMQWMGRLPKGNYSIDVLLNKQAAAHKSEAEFHLTLEEIVSPAPEETEQKPDSELINTRWKLIQVKGNEIETPEGGSDIYMILQSEANKVTGYAGCNNFFGEYEVSENSLHFHRLASTKRACPELDTESAFLAALDAAEEYRIEGEQLTLYTGGDPVVVLAAISSE
jgi:heat shock protein HslJ